MWGTWFPWTYLVRRAAVAQGFLDPILVLSRLRRFAQPAEVVAPTELLRAGVVLHARGLMNSQAIQHNLDWIWPYWVARQFDPRDDAFVPRAFSLTHINLTHRNWTAIGLPDCAEFPLVDPRGLVTPWFDGWSLDSWIVCEDGRMLIPSRLLEVSQRLDLDRTLAVVTQSRRDGLALESRAEVVKQSGKPVCRIAVTGRSNARAWLVVSLRPYNPEGVSFIHDVEPLAGRQGWKVNGHEAVLFGTTPDRAGISTYRQGDVARRLPQLQDGEQTVCNVGMATAAALFELHPDTPRELVVGVPLSRRGGAGHMAGAAVPSAGLPSWDESLRHACVIRVPDASYQFLYDAALRTLVLHSPGDVYPGPYTYKRFWFRDAAFIIHALLCAGLADRAERALDHFPSRQTPFGYFLSQDGEWDANGEALWILRRFQAMTGQPIKTAWRKPIARGARWIVRKRLMNDGKTPHAGLLPAGFSAEHLGPNDYYYWDDFWGVAGLSAAAEMQASVGETASAAALRREAEAFMRCIERSLEAAAARLGTRAMPASPYRRVDAGAIGSLAVGYPLRLWPTDDVRVRATVDYVLAHCFLHGAFFQEISHSGMNPYLTLHVAQALLRCGDARYAEVMQSVAALASPTGQWPEAVHPRTRGGCMGDGQHVWAAAEWVLMLRNCFVREEEGRLIVGSGIPRAWLQTGQRLVCGPTLTSFGRVSVTVEPVATGCRIQWDGVWHASAPSIEIHLPGRAPIKPAPGQTFVEIPNER